MTQYLLLIQNNATSHIKPGEWEKFFVLAKQSGLFKGGSQLGERIMLGNTQTSQSSAHIVGYMRFDTDDQQALLELLLKHPVAIHGGSIELCEMPVS